MEAWLGERGGESLCECRFVARRVGYLGRSEQSVQHLIFQRELPVVRVGKRVHLHRPDLDDWIGKNKY